MQHILRVRLPVMIIGRGFIFLNGKVGVTITTVGKIFTSFITIIGIGFVAVPTGLLTSALSKTSE